VRTAHVYRLQVTFPPGALRYGWEPPGWEPDRDDQLDPACDVYFRWPAIRDYLTKTNADRRAALLRSYGAEVTVLRSQPVTW
jgi:hypothetical protein